MRFSGVVSDVGGGFASCRCNEDGGVGRGGATGVRLRYTRCGSPMGYKLTLSSGAGLVSCTQPLPRARTQEAPAISCSYIR